MESLFESDYSIVENEQIKTDLINDDLRKFRCNLTEAFRRNDHLNFLRDELDYGEYEKLKETLFPVQLRDLYVNLTSNESHIGRFPDQNCEDEYDDGSQIHILEKLERFSAVTDMERKFVFAVVTENYHLVHNLEAVAVGFMILGNLFEVVSPRDLHLLNAKMTSTRAACIIDFTSTNVMNRLKGLKNWFPFLRIINSYNRTEKLKFEIGFSCDEFPKNNILLKKKSISITATHTKKSAIKVENFIESIGDIKALELEIIEDIYNLKRYYISQNDILPLLFKVFDLRNLIRSANKKLVTEFFNHIQTITRDYINMFDPTGYAALNILSEFACNPVGVVGGAHRCHQFQEKTGTWMIDFCKLISDRDFKIDEYLKGMPRTHAHLLKICE